MKAKTLVEAKWPGNWEYFRDAHHALHGEIYYLVNRIGHTTGRPVSLRATEGYEDQHVYTINVNDQDLSKRVGHVRVELMHKEMMIVVEYGYVVKDDGGRPLYYGSPDWSMDPNDNIDIGIMKALAQTELALWKVLEATS